MAASGDVIALQTVWHELIAAADEMAFALVRTSFSTIVKDNKDFACSVLDPDGNLLAQSTESVPSYIGLVGETVRHLNAAHPTSTLRAGDVLVTNDPWLAAGHLHDVLTASPVFAGDRLVAWVAVVSHVPDIGGALSPTAREVYAEGLCLPPLRLVEAGHEREDLISIVRANVRSSFEVVGDLRGQVAALTVGTRKVLETLDRHGLADLRSFADDLFSRSERLMRSRIEHELTPGTYTTEITTTGADEPLVIRASVEVDADAVRIDYAGTDAQSERPINSVYNYTYAMTLYAFKCLLDPETPNNAGSFRPFAVIAPEGTLVNPTRPASVWSRHLVGHYLPFMMFRALAGRTRRTLMAESAAPSWAGYFRGEHDGRPFSHVLFCNGGLGARSDRDGVSAMSFPSNTSNISVEVLENSGPMRVLRRALRDGSGGDGRYRGGLGQEMALTLLPGAGGRLVIRHEHVVFPPAGLEGGGDGARGRNLINGTEVAPKGEHPIRGGDEIVFELPGGGGFGAPEERDPAAAERDRAAGYVVEPEPALEGTAR